MSSSDGDALRQEGLDLFGRGHYERALTVLEDAMRAFADNEDEDGQAEMLNAIGVLHRQQHNPQRAIAALEQAEAIFTRLGDQNKRGQVVGNLADAYASAREHDKAARCYSDAAAVFAKDGDLEKQGQVLRALSLMRLRQGRLMAAMMHMEESLRVRPRISLPQRLFRALLKFALKLVTGT